jgi:hypothetical protein
MITEKNFDAFMESAINNTRRTLPYPLWVYVAEQRIYGGIWMLAYAENITSEQNYTLQQLAEARIKKETMDGGVV